MKGRFLTLTAVIRVMQIEASHTLTMGDDEFALHTPETVSAFRESVYKGCPNGKITWAFSWLALNDQSDSYCEIRALVKTYHLQYGDDVTYIAGGYFPNAYATREQVRQEIRQGLSVVRKSMGIQPKCLISGFLSAENQRWLAEEEDIHVCQGNIWSQFAIDNQDGDGSICYPYYPSREHFCKPAQSANDFIDCVNLDGWTVDFLAARRQGFAEDFNSRMGVGPIETLCKYPADTAMDEIKACTRLHFDKSAAENGFGWVTAIWEIFLVTELGDKLHYLTRWLNWAQQEWPNMQMLTKGEFGLLWRKNNRDNSQLTYHFVQRGTGIGGSDADKEIEWFMNQKFRLALLRDLHTGNENVIDFTRYDIPANEPASETRKWSLLGSMNQKNTRPEDTPRPLSELPEGDRALISSIYPSLIKFQ